jgi:chromosome segregation ATPase
MADISDLVVSSLDSIQKTLADISVKVTRIEDSSKTHAKDIEDIKDNCSKCQERIDKLETGFAALKQARDTAVAVVKFAYPKLWTLLKYALAVAGGAGGLEVIKRAIGA